MKPQRVYINPRCLAAARAFCNEMEHQVEAWKFASDVERGEYVEAARLALAAADRVADPEYCRVALADLVKHHNPESPCMTLTVPWRVWEAAHEALNLAPPDAFGDIDGQGSD